MRKYVSHRKTRRYNMISAYKIIGTCHATWDHSRSIWSKRILGAYLPAMRTSMGLTEDALTRTKTSLGPRVAGDSALSFSVAESVNGA